MQKNKNILDGIIFDKNNEKLSFNDDILFPTEHLEILLENAKKNINFNTAKVFLEVIKIIL